MVRNDSETVAVFIHSAPQLLHLELEFHQRPDDELQFAPARLLSLSHSLLNTNKCAPQERAGIGRDRQALSAADRAIIEESALAVTYDTWTSLGVADNAAMATFAERGVTIVDLDPIFIDQIRVRGRAWVNDAARRDPAAAEVLAAYDAYRATWAGSERWRGVDDEG